MWLKYKLSEIGTIIGGATPPTSVDTYYNGNIPWITPKDLSDFSGRYIEKGERNISELGLKNCSAQLLPAGSVLFSSRAPIGYVAIAKNSIATNQGFKSIVPDKKKINSLFLYYLLKFNKNKIEALGSGTTFKEVSGFTMKNVEVFIPSLKVQQQIAGVLGALDDKIELNRRINENLEQQAQALFKSWFVDFEPFKDGQFVDSELGMIPEGWKVKKLGELCDSISVTHPCKEGQLIFLNTGDIENGFVLNHKYMNIKDMPGQAKKSIQENDILYSEIRPINRHFAFVNFPAQEYIVSTKLMVLRANDNESSIRLYQYLTSEDVINGLQHEAESRSGTFPQIRFENIKSLKILIGSDDVEKQYTKYIENIYKMIFQYRKEIIRLEQLRDTLLSRLMSGELEIKDNSYD